MVQQKKKKKKIPSNFVLSKFERTEFERTINLGLYSKEQNFSFETNFERTLFDQTTYPDNIRSADHNIRIFNTLVD